MPVNRDYGPMEMIVNNRQRFNLLDDPMLEAEYNLHMSEVDLRWAQTYDLPFEAEYYQWQISAQISEAAMKEYTDFIAQFPGWLVSYWVCDCGPDTWQQALESDFSS